MQGPYLFRNLKLLDPRFEEPREGYEVAGYHADPVNVTVVGPESSVERTRSVVTDPIDISGVISSAQFRANTYLAEPQVRFQAASQISVHVTVKKK